jgi:hypothetical protein
MDCRPISADLPASSMRPEDTTMATIETIYRTSEGSGYDTSQPNGSRWSVTSMLASLERRLEKRRSRMALLEMSDEQLKD